MQTKKILINGDVSGDHFLGIGNRPFSDSPANQTGSFNTQMTGGAYLVYDLLKELAPKTDQVQFGLNEEFFSGLPSENQSYVTLASFLREDKKTGKKVPIWRIARQLGFGGVSHRFSYANSGAVKDVSDFNMVILDDAGMDFGSHKNSETAWPDLESLYKPSGANKPPRMVIYKKSGNLAKGELWKELLEASANGKIELVSLVTINDIRRHEARVSSNISWEQTALDLAYEIKNNVHLKDLLKSKYLIVTIQSAGALLIINKGNNEYVYKLIYDPKNLEKEWDEKQMQQEGQWSVIGKMSCFTASLAANLNIEQPKKNYNIESAISTGLLAIRAFYTAGYKLEKGSVRLPVEEIKKAGAEKDKTYSTAFVPAPDTSPSYLDRKWTIMKDNYLDDDTKPSHQSPMYELARNVVQNGMSALINLPAVRMNHLFTVDRSEIEGLRNIKTLINSYIGSSNNIPLSIAVFGTPGSGKSFGVKQIGKGIMGKAYSLLEFNLSQFSDPVDLIGAFHQVRDEILKGKTPIVFWDEFDANEYFWLQYLLAPMQDGAFQDGQITHTLGKCIMVFAGATSYKMEFFGAFDRKTEKAQFEHLKLKKGPDFKSRINGFLNVNGPDPNVVWNQDAQEWETDTTDICFPVRRALFIRQILGLKDNQKFNIDWGLLNALLKVKKYKHGARSLVNLLQSMKNNSAGSQIQRCHLPSNTMLNLYIEDLNDFFTHLNENLVFNENVNVIAPAIHATWMDKSLTKNPDYEIEYNLLPVFIKASNVAAATRIPIVLGIAKLKVVEAIESAVMTEAEYHDYIQAEKTKNLEKMAEEEHRLWMNFYLENNWSYAENRDDYNKKHNCLVDYHDDRLTEADKKKDWDQVKKYWSFLDSVGFGIVKE